MTLSRTQWLGLFARASDTTLSSALDALGLDCSQDLATAVWIRPVETGLIQVMGRADGQGAPFCFQEATSTRASLRLSNGQTGHALVLGHRSGHCKRVAWLDAKMQEPLFRDSLGMALVEQLLAAEGALRASRLEAAEKTRVEFFTLAREAGA
ncbi:MAG: hypothetical protein RLY30_1619 [Pseudomonadota bacterium]